MLHVQETSDPKSSPSTLTFRLKIGPKFEDCILKLGGGIFSSGECCDLAESDIKIAPLRFFSYLGLRP